MFSRYKKTKEDSRFQRLEIEDDRDGRSESKHAVSLGEKGRVAETGPQLSLSLTLSFNITPSQMWMVRSAMAARPSSWVTMTKV